VDWKEVERRGIAEYERATSADEISAVHVKYLGRKAPLPQALREVRDRETGQALNSVRVRLEEAEHDASARVAKAELDRVLSEEQVDVTLPGAPYRLGHLHLITQVRREVEDAFLGLGYEIFDDREVETVRDNFDALNFPRWHPARSPRDSYFLDDETVLRTETSPSQIHVMQSRQRPIYMVSIGRCYRRDAIDATHYTMFLQFEGLAVDRGLTLGDLKGTLRHVMRALYGPEREVRFRTHYFPFTEPSIEPDISCPFCDSAGCKVCKWSGWIEMGGAGMVDPAVFEWVGYDPDEVSGFAFGMGLERTTQLRHGVADIRLLWQNDLRFLRQF